MHFQQVFSDSMSPFHRSLQVVFVSFCGISAKRIVQQITLYPHRDENNEWLVVNATNDSFDYKNEPPQYLTTGPRLTLRHNFTQMHLHSHDIRPPVSDVDFQNEV